MSPNHHTRDTGAFIVLDDDPTCRPAFRGLYIESIVPKATDDGKENKAGAFFSRVFGTGPEVLSLKDATSFFSWNDVEKRLVRAEGPPPAAKQTKQTTPGGSSSEPSKDNTRRVSLLANRPWQPRELFESGKFATTSTPQVLNLGPTIVAVGTNKISLKYLRKQSEAPILSKQKREPFFKLYEGCANSSNHQEN